MNDFLLIFLGLFTKISGSCFDINYDRAGTNTAIIGSVASPDDCQSRCQINVDCDFFVYVPSTLNCYLRNGAGKKYESNNIITGPKYCDELDCFDYDLDWWGTTVLSQPGIASPRDCQDLCNSNGFCSSFVYRTYDRYCFLRNSKTGEGDNINLVSGPKSCSFYGDSCFYYQINIWGNDLRWFDGCPSAYHCNFECQRDDNCFFFTFDFVVGRCHLKTGAMGTKRFHSNLISGPKTCTRMLDYCLFHHIDINVNTFRTIIAMATIQHCQYECQQDDRCLFFTYHVMDNNCYLKSGFGTSVAFQVYFTSGPKYCGFNTGVCDNYMYTKSDGSLKCGSFLEHKLTIFEASRQCALINAIIPEIPSPTDQQTLNILRLTAGPGPTFIDNPYRNLWIGLNDVNTEGTFIWNSTGNVTTHTKWSSGNPDNANNEDYVFMYYDEQGLWNDAQPTSGGIASMCERSISSPIPNNCNTAPYTKSDGSYVCGFVLPSQLPFLQASIQCGQMGGRLPEVKSAFDNQYLQILFNFHKPGAAWTLGLSDKLTEGTWIWNSTGATLTSYSNWGSGEPGGSTNENCVFMNSATGGWGDVSCTGSYWVMCEKVLQVNPKDLNSSDFCITDYSFKRICFRDLGTGSFETGNSNCQSLGGHLPVVNKSLIMTFLAKRFEGKIWMSLKTDSASNICTGAACVSSNKWFWIGSDGLKSSLQSSDLALIKDMVSSADAKTCIYFNKDLNDQWFWNDGLCASDNFRIVCQLEDQDMLSEKHRCIEDNYSNNGNIFQSAFQIPSAAMCQFECQNVKGCVGFNYFKRVQQCDFLNTWSTSRTLRPNYMTGPQMCGIMTGSFYKYSAIEILAGGLKRNDRNETADSLVACAGKCNAAFLESASCTAFQYSGQRCELFMIGPDSYEMVSNHKNKNEKTMMRDKLFLV